MDRLIILILIYIVALFILNRVHKIGKSFKFYYIMILVSALIVILGCLTPINYVYAFAIAYLILIFDYLLVRISARNLGK